MSRNANYAILACELKNSLVCRIAVIRVPGEREAKRNGDGRISYTECCIGVILRFDKESWIKSPTRQVVLDRSAK